MFKDLVAGAEIFFKNETSELIDRKLTKRKLRLMNATTIAMNILQARGPEARTLLAERLHTPTSASTGTTSLNLAKSLKKDLDVLINGALEANKLRISKKFTGVVLGKL